ncbi:MAG: phosphoglucosamine mutase, partial [Methyloligellaceae bacterium]
VDPNGVNINTECGSTSPEFVSEKVREVRADIGIALDGDADRVILVDENGSVIDGDQLMAVIADFWQSRGRLASNGIVATVMSNLGLERYLNDKGLVLARTPVGDRYVVEHMRKHGFNVGGEQSGHVILSDFTTTGDGLITALQIIAVVIASGKRVSEVCNRFEPLPQILENVRFGTGFSMERQEIRDAIDVGRRRLGTTGRLVIRPSGTEPVIRVMAEGDDASLVSDVVGEIVQAMKSAAA